jgi:hypothetical protein
MKSDNWEKPRLWAGQKLRSKATGKKSNIASAKADRAMRRKILPGYPIEKRNLSDDEIKNLLSGEKMPCLLCGKIYKSVSGPHLQKIHGITDDAYREMYGLPYGFPLCGQYKREKAKADAIKRINEGTLILVYAKKGENKRKGKSRVSEYAKRRRKENVKKARPFFNRENVTKAAKERRKLSDEQITEILKSAEPHCILAKNYGVCDATIFNIRKGKYADVAATNVMVKKFKPPRDIKTGRIIKTK